MDYKHGYYDLFGNTVEYFGGGIGLDLDSREEYPMYFVIENGEYIGESLDWLYMSIFI